MTRKKTCLSLYSLFFWQLKVTRGPTEHRCCEGWTALPGIFVSTILGPFSVLQLIKWSASAVVVVWSKRKGCYPSPFAPLDAYTQELLLVYPTHTHLRRVVVGVSQGLTRTLTLTPTPTLTLCLGIDLSVLVIIINVWNWYNNNCNLSNPDPLVFQCFGECNKHFM